MYRSERGRCKGLFVVQSISSQAVRRVPHDTICSLPLSGDLVEIHRLSLREAVEEWSSEVIGHPSTLQLVSRDALTTTNATIGVWNVDTI